MFGRSFVMRASKDRSGGPSGLDEERERQIKIAQGEIAVELAAPQTPDADAPELGVENQVAGKPPVISSGSDVPDGEFLDITKLTKEPLPEIYAESFAAIFNKPGNLVMLLVEQGTDKRMVAEVMARLRAQPGGAAVAFMRATADVIRMVVDQGTARVASDVLSESDVEKRAKALLIDAEMRGTSDIHIESRSSKAQVFYRIHGKRISMGDLSLRTFDAIANYLFNWQSQDSSRSGTWQKRSVQDASFAVDLPGGDGEMHVRFHSAPIHPAGNVQVVMRLLRPPKRAGGFRRLEDVLYTPEQKSQIYDMLTGGHGVVLVVGPTNSGKSSSLQSFVEHIREARGLNIKISTIENPVEYEMAGACQMAASEDDFALFMRATLRQDTDVVVVGEIRGEEAAETTKTLILGGHKIITTLHVYEAFSAFTRLIELGIPRALLAMPGFVSGVVYQRLLPVVCPDCSYKLLDAWQQKGLLSDAIKGRLQKVWDHERDVIRLASAGGCERCKFSGYVSRMPIAEVLKPDQKFLELVRNGRDADAKAYWERSLGPRAEWGGSPTALAHAITEMKRGLIDPRDIEAELAPIEIPVNS